MTFSVDTDLNSIELAGHSATAQSAIAILLDLAQRGEIDPWDVQVIEVIDRYLSKLGLNNSTEEANLPQSGQAFLWASMLVLLKAKTLELLEEEVGEESEFEDPEIERLAGERALPLRLEQHIRRRAAAPPPQRRRVTLQELIEQIQQMAAVLEEAPPPRTRPVRSHSRRVTAKAIADLAHNENLTEIATQLDEFLSTRWSELLPSTDWLNLEQLLAWWSETSIPSNQSVHEKSADRVGVFWALLLLSAQSKVELSQEEFYQDLKIRLV